MMTLLSVGSLAFFPECIYQNIQRTRKKAEKKES